MNLFARIVKSSASAAIIVMAAGCAVLTIDVDVYKGPLTDSEDIQTEEIFAMVIAAKPLLVRLRNQLEIEARDNFTMWEMLEGQFPHPVFLARRYLTDDGYMPPSTDFKFYSRYAAQVNAILSRYNNYVFSEKAMLAAGSEMKGDSQTVALKAVIEAMEARLQLPASKEHEPWRGIFKASIDSLKFDESVKTHRTVVMNGYAIPVSISALAKDRENWQGFEALIKEYRATPVTDGNKKRQKRREALLDLFQSFGQEIRSLANTSVLIHEPRGLAHAIPQALHKTMVTGGLTRSETSQFTIVLQAVGNSIVNQIDELKKRDQYDTGLKGGRAVEARAAKLPYPVGPSAILDQLMANLHKESAAAASAIEENSRLESKLAEAEEIRTAAQGPRDTTAKAEDEAAKVLETAAADHGRLDHELESIQKVQKLLQGTDHPHLRAVLGYTDPNSTATWEDYRKELLEQITALPATAAPGKQQDDVLALSDTAYRLLDALPGAQGAPAVKRITHTTAIVNGLRVRADEIKPRVERAFKAKEQATATHGQRQTEARAAEDVFTAAALAVGKAKEELAARSNPANPEATIALQQVRIVREVVEQDAAKQFRDQDTPDRDRRTKVSQLLVARLRERAKQPEQAAKPPGVGQQDNSDGAARSSEAAAKVAESTPVVDKAAVDDATRAANYLQQHVELMGPPLDSDIPVRDKQEALDAVIAALRHQEIQLTAEYGADSAAVRNVREALKVAQQQRENTIYLRPASAYLRSSYAAASLQPDAKIGWRNTLGEHAVRQMPFASELFHRGADLKAILAIDKQYWQNINTVRVAGGGRTNYVVTKDDIGNWYVKNYSADPKDIIRSAKNLAMYSLSSVKGFEGLSRVRPDGSIGPSQTTLDLQYERFASAYLKEAEENFISLMEFATKTLPGGVSAEISKAADVVLRGRLEKEAEAAAGRIRARATELQTLIKNAAADRKPTQHAERHIDLMRAVRSYFIDLNQALLKTQGDTEAALADATTKLTAAQAALSADGGDDAAEKQALSSAQAAQMAAKANVDAVAAVLAALKSAVASRLDKDVRHRIEQVQHFNTVLAIIGESADAAASSGEAQ